MKYFVAVGIALALLVTAYFQVGTSPAAKSTPCNVKWKWTNRDGRATVEGTVTAASPISRLHIEAQDRVSRSLGNQDVAVGRDGTFTAVFDKANDTGVMGIFTLCDPKEPDPTG